MRIVCWQKILMKHHTIFFLKIRKDVARFVICCSHDWHFKGLYASKAYVLRNKNETLSSISQQSRGGTKNPFFHMQTMKTTISLQIRVGHLWLSKSAPTFRQYSALTKISFHTGLHLDFVTVNIRRASWQKKLIFVSCHKIKECEPNFNP